MEINIAEQIKAKRREMKLSQKKFALLKGFSRCQIADWETGRSQPNAENYLRVINDTPTS